MKKISILLLVLFAALALVLTGCGQDEVVADQPAEDAEAAEAEADPMIAAMATDVGGLGDKSFNDGAYAGLEMGADLGFEARVVESNQQTDYIPNLTGLAEDGAEIVFAVGFLMEQAVKEAAQMNPDTYFGGIDIGGDPEIPNFQGILYKEEQSGFLAGVVAGHMTAEFSDASPKLNPDPVVGVVLGMFIPPVERYEVGFIQGVKYANPDVEVLSVTAGDFTDQARGNEAATAMGEQGADIIFHAAGLTGLGAIQAAKDAGILAIGVDVDQNNVAPDTVLTSAIKKIPESVYVVLESVANDNFEGGTKSYGLAEDATGIAPFHGFDDVVPQEVKDAVATAREDILSGEIEVATTRAEIEDLLD
ncbi:MAG: BMP family ABC transporter substrate-binding protein [Spirochaeta sp.]|jgi:basic membrane protein A|nr:BMP family ABC transporter substrate-binding protein [Spirochaeta sp.]